MNDVAHMPDLRARAEEKARRVKAMVRPLPVEGFAPGGLQSVLHELHVHQVELEMQIDELRHSQHALDRSQARYFDLFHRAPVGYFIVSQRHDPDHGPLPDVHLEGVVLEVNLTGADLLGLPLLDIVGKPLSAFIFPADQDVFYRFRRASRAALASGVTQVCELRIRDGQTRLPRPVRLDVSLTTGDHGEGVMRIAMSDLSDRKRHDLAQT